MVAKARLNSWLLKGIDQREILTRGTGICPRQRATVYQNEGTCDE